MIRRTPAIFTKKAEEIEKESKKLTFENISLDDIKKVFSLKNVGAEDDNVPTVRDVKKLINDIKPESIKIIESPKNLDDIQDGKTYVKFSIEDKEKLNLIEKGADITSPQKVRSSGATMNNDENIKDNKWVVDDFTSDTDQKVPTQRSIKLFVLSSAAEAVTEAFEFSKEYLKKLFPPNSIARSDDKGNIIPLKPKDNTVIGRLNGVIVDLTGNDIRNIINVEDGADKTTPMKVKMFGAIMNTDESIKDSKWVVNEDDMKSNSDEKVPTQKSIVSFISSLFKSKSTDDLKEGSVHKYFSGKSQDQLPDGINFVRYSKEDKVKLSGIQDKADITSPDRVKHAGATMNNDTSVKGKAWTTDDINATPDKVPTLGLLKRFFESITSDNIKEGETNKFFNNKTTDNLKEGIVNKFFNNKTSDDLKEGNTNKYLTNTAYENIKKEITTGIFNDKTTDNLKEGIKNKYLTSNTTTDNIKEGKINKYLNNKTTDDLPEGEKNKYFRIPSHSELSGLFEGDLFHLTKVDRDDLLTGQVSVLHTHKNIPDIHLTEDARFNGFKSIGMCCDNGPKVPKNPKLGQWFLHTPKRRKILLQFDGTKWVPIFSDDNITFYVDTNNGQDVIDNGTDTGTLSFKTITYAIKQIPKSIDKNIFILVSGGIYYTENIVINGNYSITFIGILQKLFSAVVDSSITGSGVSQGYINDSDSFGKYENKLLYSSKGNEYRIIDSDVSDRATICGCWSVLPNGEYSVFDWATTIVGNINITNSNSIIKFIDFKFQNSFNISGQGELIYLIRCNIDSNLYVNHGKIRAEQCLFKQVHITNNSICQFYNVKFSYDNDFILKVGYASNVKIGKGCIFEGDKNTTGTISYIQSIIDMESNIKDGYNIIRNCDIGVCAKQYGMIVNSDDVQYINNNLKKNIIYSSHGYID